MTYKLIKNMNGKETVVDVGSWQKIYRTREELKKIKGNKAIYQILDANEEEKIKGVGIDFYGWLK